MDYCFTKTSRSLHYRCRSLLFLLLQVPLTLHSTQNPLNPLKVIKALPIKIERGKKLLPLSICRRGDLNPHGSLHTPLKRARLPFRHYDIMYSFFIQLSNFLLSSRRMLISLKSTSFRLFGAVLPSVSFQIALAILHSTRPHILRVTQLSVAPLYRKPATTTFIINLS